MLSDVHWNLAAIWQLWRQPNLYKDDVSLKKNAFQMSEPIECSIWSNILSGWIPQNIRICGCVA